MTDKEKRDIAIEVLKTELDPRSLIIQEVIMKLSKVKEYPQISYEVQDGVIVYFLHFSEETTVLIDFPVYERLRHLGIPKTQ